MAHAADTSAKQNAVTSTDEVQRVREQLAARLLNRGVHIHSQDTSDALGTLTEAVEEFEAAVEARGGDLMVDEPPAGHKADPDNAAFVLPQRTSSESAHSYASRIEALTAKLRA